MAPRAVNVGDDVTLTLALRSRAASAQPLLIDYTVHRVLANGATSAKVFKGWKLTLAAGEERTLIKRHSFKAITTRRYHAGTHAFEVSINGAVQARAVVKLTPR